MSVSFATRRMWFKRARRTGLALTRIFSLVSYVLPPVWIFWFYRAWIKTWKNRSGDGFVFGCVLQLAVFTAIGFTTWQMHLSRDATPDELRNARATDACFDNTIVRRAAAWNRPITVRDVWVTQEDCAKLLDDIARKKAQAAVLKQQLGNNK